jgi:hypothetical protein
MQPDATVAPALMTPLTHELNPSLKPVTNLAAPFQVGRWHHFGGVVQKESAHFCCLSALRTSRYLPVIESSRMHRVRSGLSVSGSHRLFGGRVNRDDRPNGFCPIEKLCFGGR